MKIAVVQDFLRSGGTERQTVLLANAFARAGYPTTLFTFRPGGALESTLVEEVARETLQPFDLGLDWFAPGLVRRLSRFEPDVILCMGRMANCYAGMLQEKLPDAVVVATMRTGKTLPARYVASLHAVRHVVANSRDARNTLMQGYSVDGGKISLIHNSLVFPPDPPLAADTAAKAAAMRATTREAHGATPSTQVMTCVAMFRPEKNQRELIEIMAGLPPDADWQLWLAGEGPARAACEELAAARQLGAHVKFLGFVSDPKALYCGADIAVHASSSEALSNFLIEAQAHGLPCVAYEVQGIEECFLPERTGWAIERDDRKAFRAALQRLFATLPGSRTEVASTARSFARNRFDPRRQAFAYLELFHNLRNSHRARRSVSSPAA